MTVQTVLDWLDSFAPFANAWSSDNVGLLAGDAGAEVRGVLFCLDATVEAAAYAAETGCNLLVAHHPVLFHGTKRISYPEPEGRLLRALCAGDLHLIAAHTNLDQAPGGIADSLAETLGLQAVEPTTSLYLRVGAPEAPLSVAELAERVQRALCIAPRVYGQAAGPIRRVVVGPGACGEFYEAAAASGAQAFVTGEIHHHEIIDATLRGLVVLDAGHYPTEWPGVRALYQRYLAQLAPEHPSVRAALCPTPPYPGACNA